MEEVSLVKDIAVIMMVAGGITLLFRKLGQPPIVGYLIAGLLVGPYTFSNPPVDDVHTIRLLADLGLILLLFGLGLEFSWSKIRQMGLSVIAIGTIEIITMISLGYGLGRLMGWSGMDSIFLGAALHISSSAIIVKVLRDSGKLDRESSKLIVGILVVEDFAAVLIITVLSGIAVTGTANFGDIQSLLVKLIIFVVTSLVFGAIIVPRIIRFTRQFQSREAMLITSLGLCFALALVAREIELSAAAGAFLVGALIGDTENSEEIVEMVTPIRDMFGALFFVSIGMLIEIDQIGDFIVPALLVSTIFIIGKILSDAVASLTFGYDATTALEVGMGMPTMGEFSLAIAKIGTDRGAVVEPLYPVVAMAVSLTSMAAPYISRSTGSVAVVLDRWSPPLLKEFVPRLTDWLRALRSVFANENNLTPRVRHFTKTIIINMLILMILLSTGAFMIHSIGKLVEATHLQAATIGLVFGLGLLLLCVPSFVVIWRSLRVLIDEVTMYLLMRRASARNMRIEALRIILRDILLIVLSVFITLWSLPLLAGLFSIGSAALALPILITAVLLYFVLNSVREIHTVLDREFRKTLLGDASSSLSHEVEHLGIGQRILKTSIYTVRLPALLIQWLKQRRRQIELNESIGLSDSPGAISDSSPEHQSGESSDHPR